MFLENLKDFHEKLEIQGSLLAQVGSSILKMIFI